MLPSVRATDRRSARRRLALLGALLVLGVGCSSGVGEPPTGSSIGPAPGPSLSWSVVALPEDAQPTTLTADGTALLVGAQVSSGRVRPRLFSVAGDATVTPITLAPRSPYAKLARFLSVSVDHGTVTAVGGAAGGAHSNTRWTTWTGSTKVVRETPQSFSTFGGYGAGSLVGSAVTDRGPVLAGSWQGAETRLDGAVWLPQGDTWVRQPSTGTALESTPSLLVGLRSITGGGDRLVAPGSVVRLEPGRVTQTAAVWTSGDQARRWNRLDLPDADPPSEAISAGCDPSTCLVAGFVRGQYALWRLTSSGATRVAGLPARPIEDNAAVPAPLTRGSQTLGFVPAGARSGLLVGTDDGWRVSDGPAGAPTVSALVGDWLYVVTQAGGGRTVLSRADVRVLG